MKSLIMFVAWLVAVLSVSAQSGVTLKKTKFSSINQVGLVVGANKGSALVQTINGVSKEKWFAGIGVGIDFYVERGVPLFLDIRRDLTDRTNTPFVYAEGGMYSPWLNFIEKEQKLHSTNASGVYYDIGLGWKLTGKSKRSFLLSMGYSLKQDKGKTALQNWNPGTNTTESTTDYYSYNYARIVLKLGLRL